MAARGCFAAECLEAGHIVAGLEANAEPTDPELAADAAICRQVVRGVDVELAIIVAPAAGAETGERTERHRLRSRRVRCAEFGAGIIREHVELLIVGNGDVSASGPANSRRDSEVRPGDEAELRGGLPVITNTGDKKADGYVTSAAFSPTLRRFVALGMIENGRARIGETITLAGPRGPLQARIANPGAFDAKGERVHA